MKVYIAASWKHQHAVEMLTTFLRERECDVKSFVENNHGESERDRIDGTLIDALGLPKSFLEELRAIVRKTVVVDEKDTRRSQLKSLFASEEAQR